MIELKPNLNSYFVGYLGIKNYSLIEQKLILPKIKTFFSARKITDYKPLNETAAFADVDFKRENFADFFAHFYEFIVDGIYKKNGKIEIPVTYCITLDETNCSKTCDITGIRYDEILLYNQPVFYFIYIDIKDVFACLKN
ncbi:MAG TPA: hypothetical protein DDZ41_02240 [Flavobacterium sp.]|nr:hypothetical protein [Flavobacterium sp.]